MLRIGVIVFLLLTSISVQAKECISLVTARDVRHPFWDEIIRGAISASDELNIDLYYRGAKTEDRQQLIIDFFVKTYHCPGMIIAPAGNALKESVKKLNDAGISAVFIDRDVGGSRAAIVASNNFYGGVLAAQKMALQLTKRKNIAVLRMEKGIPSTEARESGFIQEAQRLGMNIIVNEYMGITMAEGRSRALSIFSKDLEIDGIFSSTGMITEAVIRTLDGKSFAFNPVHIGFDGNDYMIQKVKEGKLYGYVKQDPFNIGYQGVYTMHNILNNKGYKGEVDIPIEFVIKADLIKNE